MDNVKVVGYLSIPLEEMRMSDRNRRLLHEIVEDAQTVLPNLVKELVHVTVLSGNIGFKKSMGNIFAPFPGALKDRALAQGSFYRKVENKERTTAERIFLPDTKIMSKKTVHHWCRK